MQIVNEGKMFPYMESTERASRTILINVNEQILSRSDAITTPVNVFATRMMSQTDPFLSTKRFQRVLLGSL